MKKLCYVILAAVVTSFAGITNDATAQETATGYNPNSVNPIHESDIMFQKRVWRRMDSREKQNQSFFAYNNEITKIINEAVKAGLLHAYVNDSLRTRMSKEQFLENMQIPDYDGGGLTEEEKELGLVDDWGSDDDWGTEEETSTSSTGGVDYFLASEVSVLEIMEDVIFDKKRSRLFNDILSIKMIIPAEKFETGLRRDVAVFKYKDLVKLFRNMPDEAIWFNPQNSGEHKNLADAFALRLFSARIVKVANPNDDEIVDIYDKSPKHGIMASQQMEYKLMEMEHELWDY